MAHLNIEFKAKCANAREKEEKLKQLNAVFKGIDVQTDTYFNTGKGRLKLREGNIENALIFYERENTAGDKASHVALYRHAPDASLKQLLETALGTKAIVKKERKIYFVENVKFHFDTVQGLGSFVEVEAIDIDGSIGEAKLKEQCKYYREYLGVKDDDILSYSYSDMLLQL